MDYKVAVMASGGGSNFENIVRHSTDIGIEICVMITDHRDAYAVTRAEKLGIASYVIERGDYPDRAAHETEILKILAEFEVAYIVLAGYMKILSSHFISTYDRRIVNLHPSLLPAFKGKNGIEEAFNYGVTVTGVTVHYVNAGIDAGEIIMQETVPIRDDETLQTLEKKIHQLEYRLYPRALKKVIEGGKS